MTTFVPCQGRGELDEGKTHGMENKLEQRSQNLSPVAMQTRVGSEARLMTGVEMKRMPETKSGVVGRRTHAMKLGPQTEFTGRSVSRHQWAASVFRLDAAHTTASRWGISLWVLSEKLPSAWRWEGNVEVFRTGKTSVRGYRPRQTDRPAVQDCDFQAPAPHSV